MEWKSIETAPKDGTKIAILVGDDVCVGYYADFEIRQYGKTKSHSKGWRTLNTFGGSGDVDPRGWLPLSIPEGQ